MTIHLTRFAIVAIVLGMTAGNCLNDDDKETVIKKDRKLYEGAWRVVGLEIDGNKAKEEDAKKLVVENDAGGGWLVKLEGSRFVKGVSQIDPTKKPKHIDFTPSEGETKDQQYQGIYEITENSRKLCFAPPGKARPTEFASMMGTDHILVTFEREKAKK